MKTVVRVTLGLTLAGAGGLCLLTSIADFDAVVALVGLQLFVAGLLLAFNRVPASATRFTAPDLNPATGLPMTAANLDSQGNPRGYRPMGH